MTYPDPPVIRRPMPPTSALDAPFWEGLARGQFCMQQCASCKKWIWAPEWRCGACGAWDLTWPEIQMVGTVYSFADTHHPFLAQMREHLPFTNVLVELPQAGGIRLLGLLVGDK